MIDYSVAIRTVGKAGEKFVQEIESLQNQTIKPKHIFVLLAEGFQQPQQVGMEEYIIVPKGLVHQRALTSKYVDSEYVLILDDDVFLPEDSIEKMIELMSCHNADCIIPDTFPSHKMSIKGKVVAFLSNDVSPHFCKEYGVKIKKSGAFAYNNKPANGACFITECGAGPAFFIKTSAFNSIHYEDEYWVDEFPAGTFYEDQLMFYKLFVNGVKMMLWYDSGVLHLDAGTNNQREKSYDKLCFRSMANYVIWHRSIYKTQRNVFEKWQCLVAFYMRFIMGWICRIGLSLYLWDKKYQKAYMDGLYKGKVFIDTNIYTNLPKYIIGNADK